MGASLQQLTEQAKIAENIEAGSTIVELNPALLDGSFVADRIADATDSTLDGLVESMRESGQQVPILVRPHPSSPDRYQIAYGHRRVRAAARLGVPVRAVVRKLSDQELVVAQGKENLERRDLSFIEKAFFALHLEAMEFDRSVIMQAIATDKGDLSRYLSVAKAIPERVASAIGPAPKAGRARWLALAEHLQTAASKKAADKAIADPAFQGLDTDSRFSRLLSTISKPAGAVGDKPETRTVVALSGQKIARVMQSGPELKIAVDQGLGAEFAAYLIDQLPSLFEAYKGANGKGEAGEGGALANPQLEQE
jgi:ParB family chromosome partitioning protein